MHNIRDDFGAYASNIIEWEMNPWTIALFRDKAWQVIERVLSLHTAESLSQSYTLTRAIESGFGQSLK